MSRFKDAPDGERCRWDRKLADGSGARCGRRHVDGEFCRQHLNMAIDRPCLEDPFVMRAAQLVVSSFPAEDAAHEELRAGLFDVDQIQAKDVFRVLVRLVRHIDGAANG